MDFNGTADAKRKIRFEDNGSSSLIEKLEKNVATLELKLQKAKVQYYNGVKK